MEDPQFPASDFDEWAGNYDASLAIDQFPFLGYPAVVAEVVAEAQPRPGMTVLDLGTGTGNLAVPFARSGCELWCTDFSRPMLDEARRKLPSARFARHDLRKPLPAGFDREYDRIISAYVFHHFELDEKVRILAALATHNLAPGGRLVIADISFPDRSEMEQMKLAVGEQWEQEFYWLADAVRPPLEAAGLRVAYRQVSPCAGIYDLQPF